MFSLAREKCRIFPELCFMHCLVERQGEGVFIK